MGDHLSGMKPKQREAFLAEARARVARLDRNHDGKVDATERSQAVESTRKVETKRERVNGYEVRYTDVESWTQRSLDAGLDANGDGSITAEEVAQKAAAAYNEASWWTRTFNKSAVSPQNLMKDYESEKGQSKVNATRVVKETAQPLMDAAKSLVARFDRNGNGAVETNERENESSRSVNRERTRLDGVTVREDEVESWAVRRFLASDANGDGKVSVQEVADAASAKHGGANWDNASTASSLVNGYASSTPQSQVLSTRKVRDVAGPLRAEARDLIYRFDRNRDGSISSSERNKERLESTHTRRERINDDYVRHTEVETWLVERLNSYVGLYPNEEELIDEAARRWPYVNWENGSEARYRFQELYSQERVTRTGSSRQVYDPLPRPTPPSVGGDGDRPRPPGSSGGSDRPTPPGGSSGGDRPTPPGGSSGGDRPRPPGSSGGSDRPTPPGGSSGGDRPRPPGI